MMKSPRADTWMPMYWGDYLKDTGHLSTTEHGAYMLLIGHYWTTGKPLPDDNTKLSRLARMLIREWQRIRETIAAFFQVRDGLWWHKRIEEELATARAKVAAKAKAGAKGAAKRWHDNGARIAEPSDSQWQTDAQSQSPSPPPSEDSPKAPTEPSPPKRKRRIGTLLADDWQPSPEDLKYAADANFDPAQTVKMARAFRSYWTEGKGRNQTHANWPRAWQNWVDREIPRGANGPAPRSDRPRTGTDWLRADPEFVAAAARLVDGADSGNGPADEAPAARGTHRGDDRRTVESGRKVSGRALPKPAGSHTGIAPSDRPRLVAVDEVSAPIRAGGADRLVAGLREPGSGIGSTSGAHESDATAFGGRASAGSGTGAAQVADGPRVPSLGGTRTNGGDHAGAAADVTRAVGADAGPMPDFLKRA